MISQSLKETSNIAREYLEKLKVHPIGATVIALSGNLGSGKTTFTKAFAEACGINPNTVTSPTFVIMKSYDISIQGFKKLIHIDAYRLETVDQIVGLGWNEFILDPANIVLVEWPERITSVMPQNTHTITFSVIDENTREIGL